MPAALAAVGAFLASNTIVAIVAKAVISFAVSQVVGRIFAPKPRAATGSLRIGSADRTLTVRQPAASRRIIYGQVRTGGVYAYIQAAPSFGIGQMTEQHVIPPAPHQITLGQSALRVVDVATQTWLDPEIGAYEYQHLARVSGTPNAGEYAVSGNTLSFAQTDAGKAVRVVYEVTTASGRNSVLHLVVLLAAHEVEEIGTVYFDGTPLTLDPVSGAVTSGRYANFASIGKYYGSADQVTPYGLLYQTGGAVAATDRWRGHAYLYVVLQGNQDVYPNGIPNITVDVKGRKDIRDPRTMTVGWTDNAALCIARAIEDAQYGFGEPVNDESLIAAANICDELVALASGGYERRYTVNGVDDTSLPLDQALPQMLTAMGGRAIYSGGEWHLQPAAYATPIVALDEDDARGDLRVVPVTQRRENANAMKGLYLSAVNNWQPADYPAVTSATYEALDGGRIWLEYDLPYTTSPATARRLAKIELERRRKAATVIMPAKIAAMQLMPGDTVTLTNTQLGYSAKPFEVVEWAFSAADDGALGVDLVLRETDPSIYAWTTGDEQQVATTPQTTLVSPFLVSPPGVLTPIEELYETREGRGVGVKVTLRTTPPETGNAREYQFEFSPAGSSDWRVIVLSSVPVAELYDIAPDVYDFRVKAISALGASSTYSQTRYEVRGLAERPADVQGLTMQAISGLAVLQWTQAPELDVRRGGAVLIRHSEDTGSPAWEESYSVIDALPGDSTVAVVPLKAGTYLVKFGDSSGNQSASPATVRTKDASVLAFSTLASVTEDPAFSGTKTGLVVDSGMLMLSGSGMFDSISDLDAVANLDAFGGFSGSGTYTFAAGIDLGSVKRVRLITTLAMDVIQTSTLFDSRTETVDTWADWDGDTGAGGVGDTIIEVRETDDDPSGSPTWSDWKRLVAADYTARAFQFRAHLAVSDAAYQVRVSQLRVRALEVI